jgi:hypothetical protein
MTACTRPLVPFTSPLVGDDTRDGLLPQLPIHTPVATPAMRRTLFFVGSAAAAPPYPPWWHHGPAAPLPQLGITHL